MQSRHQNFVKALYPPVIILVLTTIVGCQPPPPRSTATPTIIPTATALIPSGTIHIEGQKAFLFGANYPWYNYGNDFGENGWGYSGVAAKRGDI